MKKLSQLPKLAGARVLIRVDYNVPLNGTRIRDTRRITSSFETIDTVIKKGGTPVLLAHLGQGSDTLRPVATFLSKTYKTVFITHDVTDSRTVAILNEVPKGTVVLLENIRRYPGEESNDKSFAKALARLGAYYINDAFSVSHRAHASVVGLPKLLPSYAGAQLIREITALSKALTNKKHPSLFILGGAKFGTKIPLLKKFITTSDHVVVAGAILNNFLMAAGFPVGESVVEQGFDMQIKKLLKSEKLLLPIDLLVFRGNKTVAVTPDEVDTQDTIVDIGPQSIALITKKITEAKAVIWNGPTGWYEKGYTKATRALADAIGKSNAYTVVGGGDTGAVIEKTLSKHADRNIFVSTGGGATLEYLGTGTLPGIKILA